MWQCLDGAIWSRSVFNCESSKKYTFSINQKLIFHKVCSNGFVNMKDNYVKDGKCSYEVHKYLLKAAYRVDDIIFD